MYKWQAIIFDLDDTLYSERMFVLSGFRAVAVWAEQMLGIPAAVGYDELTALFEAGVRGDTFNRWLASHNINEDVVSSLVRIYRSHTPQISPFPEVPGILSALSEAFTLGLLSDGYLDVQRRKLDALQLVSFFDIVLFSDELGREFWKPSTKPFETILEQLSIRRPELAVYIGDNPLKDFLGARQTGMRTIWLRRADGEYAHLELPSAAHKPDIQVTSLRQVLDLLKSYEPE